MVKVCESCGMLMEKKGDHGAGDERNRYCVHCTDKDGTLKSREEIRAGMVALFMKARECSKEEADRIVREHMSRMPAWK